jgi:5-methylcytosine-specific restriction endonuclease McrA
MLRQCKNPKCGAAFEAKSMIHAFCSDACRKALRGTEYRKARELAFIRDGYTCTECDATDILECHHMKPLCQGGDNSLKNLQTLCHKHHKAKHTSWKGVLAYEPKPRRRESEVCNYAA